MLGRMSELEKLQELLENRGFEVAREIDSDGEVVLTSAPAGATGWRRRRQPTGTSA